MKKRGKATHMTIKCALRRKGGPKAMKRVLALDIGQRDLGDNQQEDCLADCADEGEEDVDGDLQTQRLQPERPKDRAH